ncbi:hypothetical protein [Streptomyces sp. NPDC051776]|uniref:hypothetical protein n=1 Tax=Streptomyces sp. NPDC051776 TaxID=3155414 RepID=UPI0034218738
MSRELTSCLFCGQFVLQIPGWTSSIPSYRLMRAAWEPQHRFVEGSLHFSCLRRSDVRHEFRSEFHSIATGHGREITFESAGQEHTLEQPGLGYTKSLFTGTQCEIYRSEVTDSWLVLEQAGPWFLLDANQLKEIGEGRPARSGGDVERIALPKDPGPELASASLSELLEYLRLDAVHKGLEDEAEAEYEFWDYYAPKRILEYSLETSLPLPREAVEFLKDYLHRYEPINFDEL